jgi:heme oxygenase
VAAGAIPQMTRLFARDYTLAEYRAHVGRLLGIFEPLEESAAQAISADVAPHFLRRAGTLRDDLLAMGCTSSDIDRLERCRRLPALALDGMRGYVYVVLGSMLGGRVIAQRLQKVLGPQAALRFYSDGMGENDARWTRFCADLERHGGADLAAICATANATFDAFADWMR